MLQIYNFFLHKKWENPYKLIGNCIFLPSCYLQVHSGTDPSVQGVKWHCFSPQFFTGYRSRLADLPLLLAMRNIAMNQRYLSLVKLEKT